MAGSSEFLRYLSSLPSNRELIKDLSKGFYDDKEKFLKVNGRLDPTVSRSIDGSIRDLVLSAKELGHLIRIPPEVLSEEDRRRIEELSERSRTGRQALNAELQRLPRAKADDITTHVNRLLDLAYEYGELEQIENPDSAGSWRRDVRVRRDVGNGISLL